MNRKLVVDFHEVKPIWKVSSNSFPLCHARKDYFTTLLVILYDDRLLIYKIYPITQACCYIELYILFSKMEL